MFNRYFEGWFRLLDREKDNIIMSTSVLSVYVLYYVFEVINHK